MITTIEGVVKKKFDKVWEVGWCSSAQIYKPTLSKVHVGIGVANPDRCWSLYENCLKECDIYNDINQKELKKEKRKRICEILLK